MGRNADNTSMPSNNQRATAEPIRVLFVLGSLRAGGSERQVVQLLQRLDRAQFFPLLYAVYREGELQNELPADVPTYSYWERFTPPRFHVPGLVAWRQTRHLTRVLREERVDVVCERNFDMSLLSMAAGWRRPTPRVSVVSSDPTRDLPARAGRFARLKKGLVRKAYRTAHRVVAVSEGVRTAVRRFYRLDDSRVVTIHNLCDLQRIAHACEAFQPPMTDERFHLVTVARLQAEKGVAFLIDAVADLVRRRGLAQILLWIVGDGPLDAALRDQVRAARLEGHVQFTGFQANPLPYVKRAALFCLPSLYEGMPNALAEAMACGTPVVASDCPSGPREMLRDGELGRLVPPADAGALADAIEDAVRNPPAWRERTAAARLHVQRNFAAEIGVARYQALFREACSPRTT